MNRTVRLTALIGACVCFAQLRSAAITYHINLNTAALAGNPNAPFALDFQLVDGDGAQNSKATIKNFNFSGGTPFGAPILTGGASGNLASKVRLTDSGFYNDFFGGFTSGSTVSFDFSLASTAAGATPDGFAIGIGSANDGGLSFFDVFAQVDLVGGSQTLNTFTPLDGVTATVHVPEGGSMANLPIGIAALACFAYLTRKTQAAV